MFIKGKLDEIGVMNILLGKSSDTLHMCFKFTLFPKNLMRRWVRVTTAWRVLRLRMEERPPI